MGPSKTELNQYCEILIVKDVHRIQTPVFQVGIICVQHGADHDDGVLGVGGEWGCVVCP